MVRSGCTAQMGKARGKRASSGGGFGVRNDKVAQSDDLSRQLNHLVEQLNAQGNELADSQSLVDSLRAENEALRGELAKAGVDVSVPRSAAASSVDVLWDDGYEDTLAGSPANFTMNDLLEGKVGGVIRLP